MKTWLILLLLPLVQCSEIDVRRFSKVIFQGYPFRSDLHLDELTTAKSHGVQVTKNDFIIHSRVNGSRVFFDGIALEPVNAVISMNVRHNNKLAFIMKIHFTSKPLDRSPNDCLLFPASEIQIYRGYLPSRELSVIFEGLQTVAEVTGFPLEFMKYVDSSHQDEEYMYLLLMIPVDEKICSKDHAGFDFAKNILRIKREYDSGNLQTKMTKISSAKFSKVSITKEFKDKQDNLEREFSSRELKGSSSTTMSTAAVPSTEIPRMDLGTSEPLTSVTEPNISATKPGIQTPAAVATTEATETTIAEAITTTEVSTTSSTTIPTTIETTTTTPTTTSTTTAAPTTTSTTTAAPTTTSTTTAAPTTTSTTTAAPTTTSTTTAAPTTTSTTTLPTTTSAATTLPTTTPVATSTEAVTLPQTTTTSEATNVPTITPTEVPEITTTTIESTSMDDEDDEIARGLNTIVGSEKSLETAEQAAKSGFVFPLLMVIGLIVLSSGVALFTLGKMRNIRRKTFIIGNARAAEINDIIVLDATNP